MVSTAFWVSCRFAVLFNLRWVCSFGDFASFCGFVGLRLLFCDLYGVVLLETLIFGLFAWVMV